MAKTLSIAYQALTHAQAYAYEHAQDSGYIQDDHDFNDAGQYVKIRDAEPIFNLIYETKTITELNRLLATYVGEKIKRTDIFSPSRHNRCDVKGFYNAMKKTIPTLITKENTSWEHGGTECRGWYRVYGAIKKHTSYFCTMDMGRDQWMAESFYKAGVITTEEYAAYRTSMTLRMMRDERFQTNNFPDPAKIREYWRADAHERVLDMRLVRMLENA
jgi:hypothetical protein